MLRSISRWLATRFRPPRKVLRLEVRVLRQEWGSLARPDRSISQAEMVFRFGYRTALTDGYISERFPREGRTDIRKPFVWCCDCLEPTERDVEDCCWVEIVRRDILGVPVLRAECRGGRVFTRVSGTHSDWN